MKTLTVYTNRIEFLLDGIRYGQVGKMIINSDETTDEDDYVESNAIDYYTKMV